MGNGREFGTSSRHTASGLEQNDSPKSTPGSVPALGAICVLLLAGIVLLCFGLRHAIPTVSAATPDSPILASARSLPHATPDAQSILGQLPLIFEPNQGQADSSAKFISHGAGYTLLLDETGATLGLRTAHASPSGSGQLVRMKLVNSNPGAATTGTTPLPGKSNYLIGSDPRKWHRDIPQFGGVRYENVYPGIDLVFYGNQGHLEYDFRVAPQANPAQAELQFDGAAKLKLSGGDLILTSPEEGGLHLKAPKIYQVNRNHQTPVAGRFVLRAGNRVGFEVGAYDHSRELVIDPILSFSSYFGGTGSQTYPSVAVNGDGNIYLAASTTSATGFPAASTTIGPGTNVFVAKINPSQPPTVTYLTFLGGTGSDTSVGLGVDNSGDAYLVGNTSSSDFPTAGSVYQTAPEAKGTQCASITCTSVFVSELNTAGSALIYSSYLSGNGNDQANGMTIDSNRDVFIIGNTTSNDSPSLTDAFPATFTPKPFQVSPASSLQFFVTKVNTILPGVNSIAYSTYFGATSPVGAIAVGGGIAVDATGNIYFSGTTNFYNSGSGIFGDSGGGDFPILNAYQPCLDTIPPIVLSNPNPCTAPTTTPYPTDAFVAKINPNGLTGSQLLFSTYLGGPSTDTSTGLAIDSGAANIYITGSTNSTGFIIPTGSTAFQTCLNNPGATTCPAPTANTDAYVARFSNPAASTNGTPTDVALTYFTYLGGGGNDAGLAIAVDTSSNALVTGYTQSGTANPPPFPVTAGPIQSTLNGTQNAFFARINTTTTTTVTNGSGSYVTYFGGNGVDTGTSIVVDPVSLNTIFAGNTTSTNLQLSNPVQSTLNGTTNAFVVELEPAANLCITCVAPAYSTLGGVVPVGIPLTITYTLTNEGPDPATGISVSGAVSLTGVTFTSATASAGSCSAPVDNDVICTIPTLEAGASTTVAFEVTPNQAGSYEATATVIKANNTNSNLAPQTAPFTASAYKVNISPGSQTVAAGEPATYTVLLTTTQVFAGSVALTCGGLPASTTCNFTNSSPNLTNGTASTTLNVQTTAQPINTVASARWLRPFYAFWLVMPGMALLGLGTGGKTRRNRLFGIIALLSFFALTLLQPACSHGNTSPPATSGTPSGTYSLTVTATSGTFSSTAPFQLAVNP